MPRRGPHASSRNLFQHRTPAVLGPFAKIAGDSRLAALTTLASVQIETSLVKDLSASLHRVFDNVCDEALPIYFGPLLGRLFLGRL
jgi:hypothetical protein